MANCVTLTQSLSPLCCSGDEVRGSVVIRLVGDSCQLYDQADSSWVTPGRVGTFTIGDPTPNMWISCPLPCLDELVGPGGVSAIDLGFYYTIEVKISGGNTCTYDVVLDCATLGLGGGDVVPLEDVIANTPGPVIPGSPLCTAFQECETTTTLVDNGNGTFTYTNEDGASTTFGAGGGGGSETITTLVDNGNGTFTYTSENGTVTTVSVSGVSTNSSLAIAGSVITHTSGDGTVTSFDVCQIVADNCDNSLTFNAATGDLTLALHDGTTQTVNIGGSETITTLVNNGDGTFTYTSENGTVTIFDTQGGTETTTTLVNNGDGTYTYTSEDGTVTTFDVGVGPVGDLALNGDGTFTFDPGDGSTPVTVDVCTLVSEGGCSGGGTGGATSALTQVVTTGNQIAVHSNGAGSNISIFESLTTLVDNGDGTATYTNEAGQATTISLGGAETPTSLVEVSPGFFTYTNEVGSTTTFRSNDHEKLTFAHPTLVTEVSSSGLDIDDSDREVYAYAVTVDKAPTGPETFNVVDRGPTGAGSTAFISGTLAAGTLTTGIVNITPYLVNAGDLLQSNILSVNGSEKWHLFVYFRDIPSELETA